MRRWGALLLAGGTALVASTALASPVVVPPRRLDAAEVPYPPGGQGDAQVVLHLVVDAAGVVTDARVQKGAAPFDTAAIAAVAAWRFAPATKDDTPIQVRITAVVTFHAPRAEVPVAPPVPAVRASAPEKAVVPSEIVVRGEREELGSIHIPRSETRFIPGAFGDPLRAVEALPGMAPWLSGLPYYYVRGAPPENVGYAVDGVRVPLLFHVGAGPSILAPAIVSSVDLFPSAYPARYGRYAGAVIAGETTAPIVDAPHAEFGARVFDANAYGEAPFDDGRGSAMVAGRYGYTGLVTKLVAPDYSVGYWDYQARVAHRFGSGTVSVLAFGAHDELAYLGQPTFHVDFHRVDLRFDHPLEGGHLRVATTVGTDDTLTALQTNTGAGASAALRGPSVRVRAELEERIDPTLLVRAGADAGVTRFDVDAYDGLARAPHTDFEAGAYGDVVWRPSRAVELVPGLRIDAYRARGESRVAPQPRLGAKLRITPALALVSSFGTAHQEATEEVFVPAKLPNPIDESPRDSYQLEEAVDLRLPWSLRARVAAFYSRLLAPSVDGEERNAGAELFVARDFTERLGGFVSYTLTRSDTRYGPETRRSIWDRTHLLSVVASYDLGAGFRVGGRFFFESGRPYHADCPAPGCAAGVLGPPAASTTGTLPPFYRLDGRFEKHWSFAGGQWLTATLECFNALDKAEPTSELYSFAQGLRVHTQSPIILPSIGLEGGL